MNTFDQIKHATMKRFLLLFLPSFLVFSSSFSAQTGVMIQYKLSSSEGSTGSIVVYFSDGSTRSETSISSQQIPGGGFNQITVTLKEHPDSLIGLDMTAKTYWKRELKGRTQSTDTASGTVKILGNEKIGAYNCIHSQLTQNNRTSEFWTTKDIPDYEKYAASHRGSRYMGRGNPDVALKKAGADGFLVKTFSKDPRGVETSLELEKFEKQTISADKFTIPAGFMRAAPPVMGGAGKGFDYSKLKDMSPEERQKFIEKMKKENGGGN
jgi:hypothetical protein